MYSTVPLTELFIDCVYRVASPYNSSFPLLVPFPKPKGHVLNSITFYFRSDTSLLPLTSHCETSI